MPTEVAGKHFENVVIGAGMSGLAAGIRLALAGREVAVLERHNASGGLNSFYSIDGRKYDVGLHAMTNYVPPGTRGAPLVKLLRQLRIDRDELDLCEQNGSRIAFPEASLRFTNDFEILESDVADRFPGQIDGFRALAETVRSFDAFDLSSGWRSAREGVRRHIDDPLLEDMLFCPIMYYGSAEERDMDFAQFAIMFRSLFFEGFARPFGGVRVIIHALQNKLRALGGVRKMKAGVRRIHNNGRRVTELELDDGRRLTADRIISTAGLPETERLCHDNPAQPAETPANAGKLSFVETISVLDRQPAEFGWDDTIVFFNDAPRFRYAAPEDDLVDPRSGVICFPNNYQYGERELDDGFLRVTAIAHHDRWCSLEEEAYREAKNAWFDRLQTQAARVLPDPKDGLDPASRRVAADMFTPRTIRHYTGHFGGAVYGAPNKARDGRTHLDNLFIAGTDQGFLGIVGAMLSGISIANLHALRE